MQVQVVEPASLCGFYSRKERDKSLYLWRMMCRSRAGVTLLNMSFYRPDWGHANIWGGAHQSRKHVKCQGAHRMLQPSRCLPVDHPQTSGRLHSAVWSLTASDSDVILRMAALAPFCRTFIPENKKKKSFLSTLRLDTYKCDTKQSVFRKVPPGSPFYHDYTRMDEVSGKAEMTGFEWKNHLAMDFIHSHFQ